MDEKAIEAIESILARGNDVQIQRKQNGLVILEVKKEIKYRTPAE